MGRVYFRYIIRRRLAYLCVGYHYMEKKMMIPTWLCWILLCLFGGMAVYILFDLMGWTIAIWGEEDEDK